MMSDKGETSIANKEDNVCRDFLRNVCRRGDRFGVHTLSPPLIHVFYRCKYNHPAETAPEAIECAAKLQDKMEFCHDFQNGRCHRTSCKFIHCNGEVEQEFKSSGKTFLSLICNF